MTDSFAPQAATGLSTAELVHQCLHGDADAWRTLVERYARLVHSIPARQGLSRAEVDDVGQEVFLALAQNLHTIEDVERLPAWLMTTTRRVCWRMQARWGAEFPLDDGAGESNEDQPGTRELASPLPTPDEILAGWNRQELIHEALAKMGDRCRELLKLIFLDPDEPSYDEISDRLGMTKGSIGPTRNRCLQQLRAKLGGEDIEL